MRRKVKIYLYLRSVAHQDIRRWFEGPEKTSKMQAEWVETLGMADVVVTDDLNMVAAALSVPVRPHAVVFVRAGDAGHVVEGSMVSTGRVLQSNFPDVVRQVLLLRDALDSVRDLERQRTFSVQAHG